MKTILVDAVYCLEKGEDSVLRVILMKDQARGPAFAEGWHGKYLRLGNMTDDHITIIDGEDPVCQKPQDYTTNDKIKTICGHLWI